MILKRFYSFIFRYKKLFILSISLVVLYSVFTNLIPLTLRTLVNAVEAGAYDLAFQALILMAILKIAEVMFQTASMYFSDKTIAYSGNDVYAAVFEHLHNLDFGYHTNKSSGKLISIFKRGENAFIQYYDEINVWGLKTIFDFVFLLVIFSQIYPKLLFFTAFIFFLNAIVMYFTIRHNITERKIFLKVADTVTSVTVDNMIGFDTVKYFANEKYEQRRLGRILNRYAKAFIRYAITFRIVDIFNGGLISAGAWGMIGIAMLDLMNGSITIGDFVLVAAFGSTFMLELRTLVYRMRNIAKLHVDLEEYLSILDEPIEVKDSTKREAVKKWKSSIKKDKKGREIIFKDVSFSYDKRTPALTDINLVIKPEESVAFVGVSGVGKTTLTKLLMRFYDVDRGHISIGGIRTDEIHKFDLRKEIGIVPQETVLFNETIGYNIAYGDHTKDSKDLVKAAKMAHLFEFIESLPDGMDTVVGERGIKLSGGQKQRLSIARAFMKAAPIIIFDEATSNLDSESERLIQSAFWKLAKDKTTIIIAHRLSTIQKVDRIIVFDEGKIVDIGTHDELTKRESGIYKYLWELQSAGEIVD